METRDWGLGARKRKVRDQQAGSGEEPARDKTLDVGVGTRLSRDVRADACVRADVSIFVSANFS